MMSDDDEAPGPIEGAPAAAAERAATAVIAHPRHPANPPPPPAYRVVVAGWPDHWRERWGRRANELEASGLTWRDAEAQAFVEVWNQVRQDRPADPPDGPDADPRRN